MLTGYRRRFVAINMILIAVVLLFALVMQGIFVYRNEYEDLKKTMGMVLEPWRMMGDGFRPDPREGAFTPPDDDDFELDDDDFEPYDDDFRPEDGQWRRGRIRDDRIATVFYSPDTDTLTVMPGEWEGDADALAAAARAAVKAAESFGLTQGFYYMKESGDDSVKIALTRTDYLRSRVFSNLSVLIVAYPLALGLLFFISLWLSKLAAKPMEQAVEMERQFVADISHDLKTPITVVLANDAILRSNPEAATAEQMQWIDSTDAAARNMMNMVEQMLTLSSLEAAGRTVEKVPVNLSTCAEKSVLQLESVAYDRGVRVESDIAPGVRVAATEDYCMRILSGLIENALKYEPDGGTVHLALTQEKRRAQLTVRNGGSVIAPEDLPHVFERFYRGDKARTGSRGHGLGLPIVKGICDLLGAQIAVQSSELDGTAFTVTFETA